MQKKSYKSLEYIPRNTPRFSKFIVFSAFFLQFNGFDSRCLLIPKSPVKSQVVDFTGFFYIFSPFTAYHNRKIRRHSLISNILLLQSCYIIVTILLCLANTNKNKEDETMCFNFNSCSELFTALCKYFNLGC